MKKVFLVLLCAGMFAACGNKANQETPATDSTTVEETVAPVEEQAVAEAPVQEQAAPAKKTTTTTSDKQTVKENATAAAENVANAAIDKAETEATNKIVNSGKKRR